MKDLKPLTIYPIDMWPEKQIKEGLIIVYYEGPCSKRNIQISREYNPNLNEDYAFMIIPSPEEVYNQVNPRDWENMTVKELREFNKNSNVKVNFLNTQMSEYIGYCLKDAFSNDQKVYRFKSYSEIDGIIKELQS